MAIATSSESVEQSKVTHRVYNKNVEVRFKVLMHMIFLAHGSHFVELLPVIFLNRLLEIVHPDYANFGSIARFIDQSYSLTKIETHFLYIENLWEAQL